MIVVEVGAERPDDVVVQARGAGVGLPGAESRAHARDRIDRDDRAAGCVGAGCQRLQLVPHRGLVRVPVEVAVPLRVEEVERVAADGRGQRPRRAAAEGQRRLAARRQLDRRALLDAEHPRLVGVRAVEARDLDVHRAVRVLGDDERHFLVGEAAVVGDAEDALALRRCHRHVAEHLGDDRLAALLQVGPDIARLERGRRGLRLAERRRHLAEDDEIVVDAQVAEAHGHQRARLGDVEPEEVAVVAVRGVAEVQRVRLDLRRAFAFDRCSPKSGRSWCSRAPRSRHGRR